MVETKIDIHLSHCTGPHLQGHLTSKATLVRDRGVHITEVQMYIHTACNGTGP